MALAFFITIQITEKTLLTERQKNTPSGMAYSTGKIYLQKANQQQ